MLVTGMSGVGKSTLLEEMGRRGWVTVDTDYGDWKVADGNWHPQRMTQLLDAHPDIVVAGTVMNQGQFYEHFDHVVLLSAPVDVLIERVSTRANNPYGKTMAQQDDIRRHVDEVEPLLRAGATRELDATLPTRTLADVLENLSAP